MCRQTNKKAKDVMYGRLRLLAEREYISMKYGQDYRRTGKPAVYYLMPRGINALVTQPGLNHTVLHAAYNDRKVSDQFIDHSLAIFSLYRKFEELYPDRYKILTKSETTGFDYYPKLPADLHLEDKLEDDDYFLDLIDENMTAYTLRQKLTAYQDQYDEGSWEDMTDGSYPSILLVCATPKIERSLQRRVPKSINTDDLSVYTTSYKALLSAKSASVLIWSDIDEPEELMSIV